MMPDHAVVLAAARGEHFAHRLAVCGGGIRCVHEGTRGPCLACVRAVLRACVRACVRRGVHAYVGHGEDEQVVCQSTDF